MPGRIQILNSPATKGIKKESVLISTIANASGQTHVSTGMNVPFLQERIQWRNVLKKCPQHNNQGIFQKAFMPVKLQNMLPWLRKFPDKLTAKLLIKGFQEGFLSPTFSGQGCTLEKKKYIGRLFFVYSFGKDFERN